MGCRAAAMRIAGRRQESRTMSNKLQDVEKQLEKYRADGVMV